MMRLEVKSLEFNSIITLYLYDGLNVMKEYGENGQPLAQYYEANGDVVARQMFGLHGRKSDEYQGNIQTRGGLMYYMKDALGNVMDIADRIGDTIMKYRYDAFGNLFTQMEAPYNSTGFTGKSYDAKASLMDYSARWYSPKHGRFTTEDTYPGSLDYPASLHRYAYVGNNPVNYLDPTGNYFWCYSVSPTGREYSHAPPCDDPNNKIWIDDPDDGGSGDGDTGGGSDSGGSGGDTGYTPPPPTPEEIKADKRSQLNNLTGSGITQQSVLDRSGSSQKKQNYGYEETKPKPPPIQVSTSGSNQWSNHFAGTNPTNRYANLTNDFLSPSISNPTPPQTTKSEDSMLLGAGKFVYDTIIGDNINTIKDPNASIFSKSFAVIDLGSNFIPGANLLKLGGSLVVKGTVKLLKEPAKQVVKEASRVVKQVPSNTSKRWKVGDPIDAPTAKGNDPAWSTVRQRYWKNEAHFNSVQYSQPNLDRVKRGLAPKHNKLDVSKELHHKDGRNISNPHNQRNIEQVWPWEHAARDPYRHYNGPFPF
jgi:RHS repeat-associated protein